MALKDPGLREIDPDIGTIMLFGSLAEGTVRGEHFDIDIAVRSDKYLQLVAPGIWLLGSPVYRSSGISPVCFEILASMRGPISWPS